jgi:hypothetical protein
MLCFFIWNEPYIYGNATSSYYPEFKSSGLVTDPESHRDKLPNHQQAGEGVEWQRNHNDHGLPPAADIDTNLLATDGRELNCSSPLTRN